MYKRLPLAGILIPFLSFAQMSSMNDAGMYLMNMASGTRRSQRRADAHADARRGRVEPHVCGPGLHRRHAAKRSARRRQVVLHEFRDVLRFCTAWAAAPQFQSMLSLEPLTITGERYPELFQTGETAFGRAIVDGQHPHNFLMGLGVDYAHSLGGGTILQLLRTGGRPRPGAGGLSPSRVRRGAPQAPLSHHWQDSTHISGNVATVAIKHSRFAWKPAAFTAPSPARIAGKFLGCDDRGLAGFSVVPANNWTVQFSAGRTSIPKFSRPAM